MFNSNLDPFELEESAPFVDALLIQCVSDPARLRWTDSGAGGGFFVEASRPPAEFVPASLLTRDGREVSGFAARRIRVYPVALRSRWEEGEPEARRVVEAYRPGARSHTQLLAVLPDGSWAVITARGLASRDLSRAFREHARWVAARLRSASGRPYAPFAAVLEIVAGKPVRAGSAMATPFARVVPEQPEPAPVELGWAVRRRWAEVQAWRAEWGAGNGKPAEEAEEEPAIPPSIPAPEAPAEAAEEARPAGPPPPMEEAPADVDREAALAFLLSQGGRAAVDRLRQAFPEIPDNPADAARFLARTRPGAAFLERAPQAVDLFLDWADRLPRLARAAPARVRALKERLGLVPAAVSNDEDFARLAALAALRWLFRPGEREAIAGLLREP